MNYLRKIWLFLVIFVVWIVFASPVLFAGKVPFPSSYLATNFGPWSEYANFNGFVKNTAMPDVITQIYPWKSLVVDSLKNFQLPLWNPYSFSGTPLLANYQSAALSPINFLYLVLPFIDAWSIQILLQPLLAAIFMYLFVRSLKTTKCAALISSIAFMFCGFITTWMSYGTLGYAILYLPLTLFFIEKFFGTGKKYYLSLVSLSIPLSFFSGHFQISLYYLIFVLVFIIFKSTQNRKVDYFFLSLGAIIIGLLLSAPQLLPSIEFYFESVRSSLFMKTEVIPWNYISTFFAPDIFGNPVTRNAWFGHYAEWNAYIGLIPISLALYGISRKNKYSLFFVIMALVSLLLAFQTPLLDWLIALHVPVLSTSAASRIIVLFSFSSCVISAFGFDRLLDDIKNKNKKRIFILFAGLVIVFACMWLSALFKITIPRNYSQIAISNLKLPTLLLFLFILFIFLPVSLLKSKKSISFVTIILIVLVSIDMLRFATKWQPFDSRDLVYAQVPIEREISKLAPYDRVFGGFGQELPLTLKVGGVEGYDPLYIGRYGELLSSGIDGSLHAPERSVVSLSKNSLYSERLLDLLGVKYIIHKVSDDHAVWAFPFWKYPAGQFVNIYHDSKYEIYKNTKSYPRAFLVGNYYVSVDKSKMISKIFDKKFDLLKNAVIENKPTMQLPQGASGSAQIISYTPNKVEIKTNTNGNMLLVLTDPMYPGWKAKLDGNTARIERADYAFRSIEIPAGAHTIIFYYDPDSFKFGFILAVIGILGLIVQLRYNFRRK